MNKRTAEEYRQQIVKLISKITDVWILNQILRVVICITKED